MFLIFVPLAQALNYKSAEEIIEAIIKKCPGCEKVVNSIAGKARINRLFERGIISSKYLDDATKLISKYGDDGLRMMDDFGEEAVRILRLYGDKGISYLKKYGDDYVRLLNEIPSGTLTKESINEILRHPKGMVFLKESPEVAKYYEKYGEPILSCLEKSASCLDTIKLTKLSPKTVAKISEENLTWLEVTLPKYDKASADTFRDLIDKYGQPIVDFVRKNQDMFLRVGTFTVLAAHTDEILQGGRQVLEKFLEVGGKVLSDVAKKGVEVVGDTVKETAKDTVKGIGGGYFTIIVLGAIFLFLLYRYLKRKQK